MNSALRRLGDATKNSPSVGVKRKQVLGFEPLQGNVLDVQKTLLASSLCWEKSTQESQDAYFVITFVLCGGKASKQHDVSTTILHCKDNDLRLIMSVASFSQTWCFASRFNSGLIGPEKIVSN